ncbi:MAG TPA: hypothetical protein VG942_00460 [Hyphomonadaceae bacterium]|nr:hypothetical protein [Hyphomonadaceae bacterium]
MKPLRALAAVSALTVLLAASASADPPRGPFGPQGGFGNGGFNNDGYGSGRFDPNALKGLTVDSAKDRLRSGGFASARNIRNNNQQWDLWQKVGRDDQCIGFTSYRGRVSDADRFQIRECTGEGRDPSFRIRSIEGLRVDDAKNRLRSAGFAPAHNINRNKQQWDLWQSTGRDGQCIGFTSYKGTVTATDMFRDRECN